MMAVNSTRLRFGTLGFCDSRHVSTCRKYCDCVAYRTQALIHQAIIILWNAKREGAPGGKFGTLRS